MTVAQALVSASMLIVVMLMCCGSLGAGYGMLIGGTIVADWAFWPLKVTMHQTCQGHLQASGLVGQNDVGEHLW